MKEKINSFCERFQCLSGAWLKIIAMISMLADHTNKSIIYACLKSNEGFLAGLSSLFDIIGRIAFPLYCFFLVEGFYKTHSRKKYLLTLLVFGVISEVPFDMSTTASFFNMNWNNVMFTLALVLVTIWIIDTLKEKMQNRSKVLWYLASLVILLIMCTVSMYLALDYEHHAILIGYVFYLFRDVRLLTVPLGYATMVSQPWSLLGFGLTLTYNGERGRQNKMLFYWFYPVHLLVLGVLRLYLGI